MNYHNITHDDMLNGDGLRVVLWVSGCTHRCSECQNPETWNLRSGIPFDDAAREEIFTELKKDYISGLTCSGGDPLHPSNRETVTLLCKEVKEKFPNKTIWVYTGFYYDEVEDLEIMKYIDVLVDGPYKKKLRDISLPWVGSSNQCLYYLKEGVPYKKMINIGGFPLTVTPDEEKEFEKGSGLVILDIEFTGDESNNASE